MSEDEYYKYVPSFPEYIVSNYGDIKRTGRRRGKATGVEVDEDGQVIVHLWPTPNDLHIRKLDRIVAQAFIKTPPDFRLRTVIHLDGDASNCQARNLQWSELTTTA